jgi:hypothetical protein
MACFPSGISDIVAPVLRTLSPEPEAATPGYSTPEGPILPIPDPLFLNVQGNKNKEHSPNHQWEG